MSPPAGGVTAEGMETPVAMVGSEAAIDAIASSDANGEAKSESKPKKKPRSKAKSKPESKPEPELNPEQPKQPEPDLESAASPPAADAVPEAEPEAVDPALLDSIFQKIAEFEAAPAAPEASSAVESPASQPESEVLSDQLAVSATPAAPDQPPLVPVAEVVADPGLETEALVSPASQLPDAAALPDPEPPAAPSASEAEPVAEAVNPRVAPLSESGSTPAAKGETETAEAAGKAVEEEAAKMPVSRVDVIRKATTKPASAAKKVLPKWLYPVGLAVLACSTVGGGYWGWRMKHLSDEQAALVVQQQEAILKQAMEDQKKISAVQEKFQAEVDEGKKLLLAEQQKSSAAEAALKLAEEKARVATAEKSKLAEEYARFKAGKTTRKPAQTQESRVHVPGAARKEAERSPIEELVLKKPAVAPVREESGLASAVQLRPQWQALSAEQLTTLASQCQQASECIGIMLTAAEPYQRNAVEAATSRLSSIKTAKPYAGGESSDARSFASRVSDLIDENRISEAERIVDQALLADSGNSGVWMAMADLMAVKDKRKEATRALILAYELTPDKAKARRYFENSAKNAARVSLRPAYQAAVDSIFSIRLRGD